MSETVASQTASSEARFEPQTHAFQAEVSRLLEIVASALYSNKDVFLRELISNASDACDKLRYAALTEPNLLGDDGEFRIRLLSDESAGTLTIEDNGIGMDRAELVDNLGTIARSGTLGFIQQMASQQAKAESADPLRLIGQFGVGFYSAFVVADAVSVESRKAGSPEGWRWRSDGRGSFTVEPCESAPARGTRVVLSLKAEEREFLEEARLRHVVATYSDHIDVPVLLGDGSQANSGSALWSRPKGEITDQQYTEFYRHLSHSFDEPWRRLHFKVEGTIEYSGLLYLPTQKPYDLFHPDRKHGVKLYVRRVFITDDCQELVPAYLRFLRGVVDCEDLPLNVSREMLQQNPVVTKIRKTLVGRVLGDLKKQAETAPEDYARFWEVFGAVLKEGLYEDRDQQPAILELARFRSSAREGLVSLADYLAAMKEGQEAIYVITGDSQEALARSPQLEGFRAKGVEVLLLSDPIDDFWLSAVSDYQGKAFKSVTRAGADLSRIAGGEAEAEGAEAEAQREKAEDDELSRLLAFLKTALAEEVKDVRASERLTESAVCLVSDEGDMDIHLERLLRQHGQVNGAAKRILEVNPGHALIRGLAERLPKAPEDDETARDAANLLLDQARIVEGECPSDPAAFAQRLSRLVARGLAA